MLPYLIPWAIDYVTNTLQFIRRACLGWRGEDFYPKPQRGHEAIADGQTTKLQRINATNTLRLIINAIASHKGFECAYLFQGFGTYQPKTSNGEGKGVFNLPPSPQTHIYPRKKAWTYLAMTG